MQIKGSTFPFLFQGDPVDPSSGMPPSYGTDNASPPSYDEAMGKCTCMAL